MPIKNLLLLCSGILSIACIAPYIRDILRRTTKPNITTWLTWTILAAVAALGQVGAHEYRSAIFTGLVAVQASLVVVLGLKYGFAKYSTFDWICQGGAMLGLILWWLFNSPTIAIFAAATVDLIGALPTVRHAWLKPSEETASSFALSALAALLSLLALTDYNFNSMVYALYLLVIDSLIAGIVYAKQGNRHA